MVRRLLASDAVAPSVSNGEELHSAVRAGHVGVLHALLEDPRVDPVPVAAKKLSGTLYDRHQPPGTSLVLARRPSLVMALILSDFPAESGTPWQRWAADKRLTSADVPHVTLAGAVALG